MCVFEKGILVMTIFKCIVVVVTSKAMKLFVSISRHHLPSTERAYRGSSACWIHPAPNQLVIEVELAYGVIAHRAEVLFLFIEELICPHFTVVVGFGLPKLINLFFTTPIIILSLGSATGCLRQALLDFALDKLSRSRRIIWRRIIIWLRSSLQSVRRIFYPTRLGAVQG